MARTFTKLGKEIEIAVKAGGSDPSGNTRLRILIQNAKACLLYTSRGPTRCRSAMR